MFDASVDDEVLALRNHPMGDAALEVLDILNGGCVLVQTANQTTPVCMQKKSLEIVELNQFWRSRTKDIVDQLYDRCYVDRYFLRQNMVLRSGKDPIDEKDISFKELEVSRETLKEYFLRDHTIRYTHSFLSINEHGREALENNRLRLLKIKEKEEADKETVRFVIARKKGESSPDLAAGNLYRIIRETRDRYYIDTGRVEGVTYSDRSDLIFNDKPGSYVYKVSCFAADVSPQQYQNVLNTIENHWKRLEEDECSINKEMSRLMDIKQQMRAKLTKSTTEKIQTLVQPVNSGDVSNEFVWTESGEEAAFKL